MKKSYFLILFFFLAFLTTHNGFAQNNVDNISIKQNIEDLSIYPNPVNSSKTFVYITSRANAPKKIDFFNVLGKRILSKTLTGKELNITNLSKGVYILKITENNVSETRKLVIK